MLLSFQSPAPAVAEWRRTLREDSVREEDMVILKMASGLTGITVMSNFTVSCGHVKHLMESRPLEHGPHPYTSVCPVHELN